MNSFAEMLGINTSENKTSFLGTTDEGMAVIMVSSELPEILSISDRVLVMRRGRINGEFDADGLTQEEIMEKAVMASGEKGATA